MSLGRDTTLYDATIAVIRCLLLFAAATAFISGGCGGDATAKPEAKSCSAKSIRVPCKAAQIGVGYPLALSTHCGIGYAFFDGRHWVIDPPQPSGRNSLQGVMTLVAHDLADFRADGRRYAFKPARVFANDA